MKKMRKTKMRSKKNARKTKRIRGGASNNKGNENERSSKRQRVDVRDLLSPAISDVKLTIKIRKLLNRYEWLSPDLKQKIENEIEELKVIMNDIDDGKNSLNIGGLNQRVNNIESEIISKIK